MFYVYVYHSPNNGFFNMYKARVHWGPCGFCKNGKGDHPEADHDFGEWHGPFATMAEAHQESNGRQGLALEYDKRADYCREKCQTAEQYEKLSSN
jgi:hypothetical protein